MVKKKKSTVNAVLKTWTTYIYIYIYMVKKKIYATKKGV